MADIIMTRQDLMDALGKSAEEVDALVFSAKLPGYAEGTHLWHVDPLEWEDYLADFHIPPLTENERRVWEGYSPRIEDLEAEDEAGEPFVMPPLGERMAQPSAAMERNAKALADTLRTAFEAWVHEGYPAGEEVWIASELLMLGVFGFAVPLIVDTMDLQERGAETVTQ